MNSMIDSMQQMFAVDPVDNCPHCEELDATKFADKRFDQKCHSCNNIGENWICLSCQEICCSRYVNSHMVSHNKETNHPIALSFADLSFWCYGCDTYVKSHKFTTVHDQFYDQKFGDLRRDDIEGIITRMAEVNLNKDEENVDNTQSKENNEEAKKVPEEAKVVPDEAKGAQKDSETESSTKDDVTIKEDEKDEVKDDEDDGKFTREKLIKKLKNGEYKKITVLTGAGISVSAGIPDFRSPKIGLYATLKEKYDMDDPAEIFSLQKFFDSPELFYDFAKEFDWSKYDPTPTHYFISFLHHKGLLDMNFTQNIDCLELKAGIPESKLIAAHGNLAGVECPKCRTSYSMDIFKSHVDAGTIYYCDKCKKVPIKPTVVFFGENLPKRFFTNFDRLSKSDLGIVIGSSMVVSPFNALPTMYNKETNIVTINMEPITHIAQLNKDSSVFLQGKCDEVILELIKDLEWKEEFDEFVKEIKEKQAKI